MPVELDPRKKPADVKVQVSTGAGVDIAWADGHRSHYDFSYLRELCPCAICDDQRRKQAAAPVPATPAAPAVRRVATDLATPYVTVDGVAIPGRALLVTGRV